MGNLIGYYGLGENMGIVDVDVDLDKNYYGYYGYGYYGYYDYYYRYYFDQNFADLN